MSGPRGKVYRMRMGWESAHAEWRARGNHCSECERIDGLRLDSSVPSRARRALDALVGTHRGERFQPPVLLGSALDPDGSFGVRDEAPDQPDERDPRSLDELFRAATDADVRLEGAKRRGPTQSRPVWEAHVEALDAQSREAWAAWSKKLSEEPVQTHRNLVPLFLRR